MLHDALPRVTVTAWPSPQRGFLAGSRLSEEHINQLRSSSVANSTQWPSHEPRHLIDNEVSIRHRTPRCRRRRSGRVHWCTSRQLDLLAGRADSGRSRQTRVSPIPSLPHLSVWLTVSQNSLSNSQDVSVAIGLLSCAGRAPSGTCEGIDPTQELGTVLFAGLYTPQLVEHGDLTLVQNYTVTIPDDFPSGPALLSTAHFVLIGVSTWAHQI